MLRLSFIYKLYDLQKHDNRIDDEKSELEIWNAPNHVYKNMMNMKKKPLSIIYKDERLCAGRRIHKTHDPQRHDNLIDDGKSLILI